ncbi:MAG: YbaN family protein [Devosiaceae bacterium]|nr:YbaN family protein [Devosiaceae bacterium]
MNRLKKALYVFLGGLSLTLGLVGIVLPVLPTTVFLLLAAFFFGKSSQRLHHWITNHKRFGPPILDWQKYGAVSKIARIRAVSTMVGLLLISILISLPLSVIIIQGLAMAAVSLFLLTRPFPPDS